MFSFLLLLQFALALSVLIIDDVIVEESCYNEEHGAYDEWQPGGVYYNREES